MICALVLAAGQSQRMGVQKLLLSLNGRPMIARIVEEVLCGGVERVFIIVGRDGPRIREALAGQSVEYVDNPDPKGDMLSSVRCGLKVIPSESMAAMVVLGDQPGITAELIIELVRTFRDSRRKIVVPLFGEKRGHPLLFAEQYFPEILDGFHEVGLRGLLRAHPEDVQEVPFGEPSMGEDIDVPEDYRRIVGEKRNET
jgi:molybdenum cofactor cytidylyltransferase